MCVCVCFFFYFMLFGFVCCFFFKMFGLETFTLCHMLTSFKGDSQKTINEPAGVVKNTVSQIINSLL